MICMNSEFSSPGEYRFYILAHTFFSGTREYLLLSFSSSLTSAECPVIRNNSQSAACFCCAFADLKEMCELLGIEQSVLERAFSYRTVEAKLEKVSTTLNVAQVRQEVELLSCLHTSPLACPCSTCNTHLTHARTHNVHKKYKEPLLLPDWPFWVSILIHLSARTFLHYR